MERGSGATHRAPERAAQLLGAEEALRQHIGASIKGYSEGFVGKGNAAIVGYLWIRMHDAPPLHLLVPRHSMVPVTPITGPTTSLDRSGRLNQAHYVGHSSLLQLGHVRLLPLLRPPRSALSLSRVPTSLVERRSGVPPARCSLTRPFRC
jgi:hypothetical protein